MAIAKYVQIGHNVDYTASADKAYREIVALGNCIGVTNAEIKAGETGSIALVGVYQIEAETGTAIAFGTQVFFDTKKGLVVAAAGTNTVPAGMAVADKAEAGTSCLVRIG